MHGLKGTASGTCNIRPMSLAAAPCRSLCETNSLRSGCALVTKGLAFHGLVISFNKAPRAYSALDCMLLALSCSTTWCVQMSMARISPTYCRQTALVHGGRNCIALFPVERTLTGKFQRPSALSDAGYYFACLLLPATRLSDPRISCASSSLHAFSAFQEV